MEVPKGVIINDTNTVCKLVKSLYGLKQASRQWYEKLSTLLLYLNFIQAHADPTVFTKKQNDSFIGILIYVDDMILVGNSLSEFTSLKSMLQAKFGIKDLGCRKYFLGLEMAHSSTGISLCHKGNTALTF